MIDIQQANSLTWMSAYTGLPFDLVVADPPYSSGGLMRSDRTGSTKSKYLTSDSGNQDRLPEFLGDNRDQRSYLMWSSLWMEAAINVTVPGGIMCVFTDWRQLPTTTDAVQCAGWVWRGIVPWHKPASRPQPNRFTCACEYVVWCTNGARSIAHEGARYPNGFFEYRPPQNRMHVTEKPVDLYRDLYGVLSDGARILDPFLGSAASAEAAYVEARGLEYVGLELDPTLVDLARGRLAGVQAAPSLFH